MGRSIGIRRMSIAQLIGFDGYACNRTMPTVLKEGPYGFFFYASDGGEPAHVHVRCEDRVGKFWLDPVRLQRSGGLQRHEIRQIARIVEQHQSLLMEMWDDYFNS